MHDDDDDVVVFEGDDVLVFDGDDVVDDNDLDDVFLLNICTSFLCLSTDIRKSKRKLKHADVEADFAGLVEDLPVTQSSLDIWR